MHEFPPQRKLACGLRALHTLCACVYLYYGQQHVWCGTWNSIAGAALERRHACETKQNPPQKNSIHAAKSVCGNLRLIFSLGLVITHSFFFFFPPSASCLIMSNDQRMSFTAVYFFANCVPSELGHLGQQTLAEEEYHSRAETHTKSRHESLGREIVARL